MIGNGRRICPVVMAAIAFAIAPAAHAQSGWEGEHWVGTWSASMHGEISFAGRNAPNDGFENQTVRMIVHTTIGGHRARVRISNVFGATPLVVGAAHIALRSSGSAIVPASDRPLTFSGRASITIPPGAELLSDAVDLDVPQFGDLAISIYAPAKTGPPTWHSTGLHTTYISEPGDFTSKPGIPGATTQPSWYWLEGVDVTAPEDAGAVVTFGDSITDGARSTVDTDHTWPSELAQRLLSRPGKSPQIAVLNAGISGNRIWHDMIGPNGLERFGHDALGQPGVREVIVLLGINDIGFSNIPGVVDQGAGADDVIAGLRQFIERAHVRGLRVVGATLLPFEGAAYYSADAEAKRVAVNTWIRTSGAYDGVIDFDAAIRDPQHPTKGLASFDSGDHLHPNDAGYKAMGDAIDLSLFAQGKAHKKR
ncbi:MAG TPA: SGNH/GDSL hydrolase family protein [Candidatus Acidoferrales bacterium]|jgi:lysophospholipase L1-like esterase|nr:SGNH/GDSL hydrolase family protein [Candidatus Acidoferrales bacterium]